MENCEHKKTRYQVFEDLKFPWVGLVCEDCSLLLQEVRTVNLGEENEILPSSIRSIFPVQKSSFVH
jgi:hypothetical protein